MSADVLLINQLGYGDTMSKKKPMTKEDARCIQSEADRNGHNQDWKARAMSAADRNENSSDAGGESGGDGN